MRAHIECWLSSFGSFENFRGPGPVLLRNHIFCDFSEGARTPCPPPLDPRISMSCTSMDGSRKFRQGRGRQQRLTPHFTEARTNISFFLRKPEATCDFSGVGGGSSGTPVLSPSESEDD